MKKTKITATIGPSSWTEDVMKKMIDQGLNCARVNGAFANTEELDKVAKVVRGISDEVALMLDIKGHEVRLNKFDKDIPIKSGQEFIIGSSEKDEIYPITYPELFKDVKVGTVMLMDDGNVNLEVTKILNEKIHTKVLEGILVKSGKSINTPGTALSNEPLTERDREQIKHAIETGWDFVAASFIRNRKDAVVINNLLKGSHTKLIAKIEDGQGVENFDGILEEVEGIMIARGDLGVEIPYEKLPVIQKMMIRKCNEKGKIVITATQMLESMIEKPRATRAEISDVANAIFDGTDSLMLSGETSTGKYPVEAVETMKKVALETEKHIEPLEIEGIPDAPELTNALSKAAYEICTHVGVDAVIVVTKTGRTARILSRLRIQQPIFAFVSEDYYMRRMNMSKGVYARVFPKKYKDRDQAIEGIISEVIKRKILKKTDKALIIGNAEKAIDSSTYFPNIFEVVDLGEF